MKQDGGPGGCRRRPQLRPHHHHQPGLDLHLLLAHSAETGKISEHARGNAVDIASFAWRRARVSRSSRGARI